MYHSLFHKFTHNQELKALLLNTKDAVLVENSPHDAYWGVGRNKDGLNRLGKLLMQIRTKIQ